MDWVVVSGNTETKERSGNGKVQLIPLKFSVQQLRLAYAGRSAPAATSASIHRCFSSANSALKLNTRLGLGRSGGRGEGWGEGCGGAELEVKSLRGTPPNNKGACHGARAATHGGERAGCTHALLGLRCVSSLAEGLGRRANTMSSCRVSRQQGHHSHEVCQHWQVEGKQPASALQNSGQDWTRMEYRGPHRVRVRTRGCGDLDAATGHAAEPTRNSAQAEHTNQTHCSAPAYRGGDLVEGHRDEEALLGRLANLPVLHVTRTRTCTRSGSRKHRRNEGKPRVCVWAHCEVGWGGSGWVGGGGGGSGAVSSRWDGSKRVEYGRAPPTHRLGGVVRQLAVVQHHEATLGGAVTQARIKVGGIGAVLQTNERVKVTP